MLWKLLMGTGLALSVLLVGAVAVVWLALPRRRCGSSRQTAETELLAIRSGVELYFANDPDAPPCPTMKTLVAERILSSSVRLEDPWGSRFVIRCWPGGLEVASPGPDRRPSRDDLWETITLVHDADSDRPRDTSSPELGMHRSE
jgi:hypothetical protein